jgi:putative transposase
MRYRRLYVPGGTYLFTVVTAGRRPLLCEPAVLGALRAAFQAERAARPFATEAIVVLPDHLHAVWRLPPDDADFSTR